MQKEKQMTFNRLMVTILTLVALVVAPSLYGQATPQADQPKQDQQADRPGSETITGCLTESAGTYTLATPSGDQVSVSGSGDLSKHKNHTVKLTGSSSNEGGKKSLAVTKIEMVSASCSK
jgi:hypothetical protein